MRLYLIAVLSSFLMLMGASTAAMAQAPTVQNVAVPGAGTYTVGQNLDFVVNFDQALIVTGTPQLSLTIGAVTREANYVSGSGSSAIVFRYAVQPGDNDADGIAVGPLGLNGGSIRSVTSVDAVLTLNAVGSTSGVLVSGGAPVAIPTMSEWAMMTLSLALATGAVLFIQRRRHLV